MWRLLTLHLPLTVCLYFTLRTASQSCQHGCRLVLLAVGCQLIMFYSTILSGLYKVSILFKVKLFFKSTENNNSKETGISSVINLMNEYFQRKLHTVNLFMMYPWVLSLLWFTQSSCWVHIFFCSGLWWHPAHACIVLTSYSHFIISVTVF